MTPIAYINVEKRTLEFAEPIKWHTPTVVNLDRIPLFTKEALAQPEQEPVRIMGFNCKCGRRMEVSAEQGVVPAPQRTWVGLTPEEVEDAIVESNLLDDYPQDFVAIIETKLKEKNSA
jgi:hypothetical protein